MKRESSSQFVRGSRELRANRDGGYKLPSHMGGVYGFLCALGRFSFSCSVRLEVIRPEAAERKGPFLVALTHLSHIDPFLLSIMVRRPLDWMARIEYFSHPLFARLMRGCNAIEVRRSGVPVSAIRKAIQRLEKGRVVAICPEGGVSQGKDSCVRGGPIKKGVCLIAHRTRLPVLPVVMLGTDKLNRVAPWVPYRRARLWVAFGDRVVYPRIDLNRRAARDAMACELVQEYQKLFGELLRTGTVTEEMVP